jgi:hypothetical protein
VHQHTHDRQVAEDEIYFNKLREPGHWPGSFLGTLSSVRSIKANPSKGGDAKPWIYSHALRDHDRQVAKGE